MNHCVVHASPVYGRGSTGGYPRWLSDGLSIRLMLFFLFIVIRRYTTNLLLYKEVNILGIDSFAVVLEA